MKQAMRTLRNGKPRWEVIKLLVPVERRGIQCSFVVWDNKSRRVIKTTYRKTEEAARRQLFDLELTAMIIREYTEEQRRTGRKPDWRQVTDRLM